MVTGIASLLLNAGSINKNSASLLFLAHESGIILPRFTSAHAFTGFGLGVLVGMDEKCLFPFFKNRFDQVGDRYANNPNICEVSRPIFCNLFTPEDRQVTPT
jgi:hypothetical protein